MIVFPAIDLYGGKAVRLVKGDYARMTVYSDAPLEVAAGFRAAGAAWIHMVDLEGARDGGTPNFGTVIEVAVKSGLNVEIGGGIRAEETIRRYLDAGAKRVILGTAAIADPGFTEKMAARYGERLAVGADLADGRVAIRGWTEKTDRTAHDFCAWLEQIGVGTVICTDISKDGMLGGANRALYRDLSAAFKMNLVASGGVSSLEDVRALRDMGLYGAILGKALYEGRVDLARAIEEAGA